MHDLTIQLTSDSGTPWCALCGEGMVPGSGPRLAQTVTEEPVCRTCGKKHAPELVALLDLALIGERVGQMCGHVLVPPMEALLALARAAEDYAHTLPRAKTAS
jgi:hypothetical protein